MDNCKGSVIENGLQALSRRNCLVLVECLCAVTDDCSLSLPTDYVYFENSSSNPLLIRRIEELNKVSDENLGACSQESVLQNFLQNICPMLCASCFLPTSASNIANNIVPAFIFPPSSFCPFPPSSLSLMVCSRSEPVSCPSGAPESLVSVILTLFSSAYLAFA